MMRTVTTGWSRRIVRPGLKTAILFALVLVAASLGPPAMTALAAPYCAEGDVPVFRFGFLQLKEALGPIMGDPTECEHQVTFAKSNVQPTTTGVAYFSEATSVAAFSDGVKVWRLVPEGIEEKEVDFSREAGALRVLPIGLQDAQRCTELGQTDRGQDEAAGKPTSKSAFPRTGSGLLFFINAGEGPGFEWVDSGSATARVGIAYTSAACVTAYLGGYRGSALPSQSTAPPPPVPTAPPPPPRPNPPLPASSGPSFAGANMSGASFVGANLAGANFTNATLTQTNFSNANLRGANFTRANLRGARLNGANLDSVTWSNTTCPDGSNSDNNDKTCAGHGA